MARCEIRCGGDGDRCEAASLSLRDLDDQRDDGERHRASHARDRLTDRRRLIGALGLSAVILGVEVVGGLLSGSLALLSDAGHVLADMSAQVISLLALLIAARPASGRRSFGLYRLEILAALINGVLLIGIGAGVIWAAAHRLGSAGQHDIRTGIMLPVAAVGLLANLAGAWILHGARSLNARGAYLHVLSDALASVAVVVGGVIIWLDPRLVLLDSVVGMVIAGLVILSAFRLLREATDVLLEATPPDIDPERVRSDVEQVSGILNVHDLHIWTITSGLHALSAHLVVENGTGGDDVLCRVKALLARDHRIAHSTLQIESATYERHAH